MKKIMAILLMSMCLAGDAKAATTISMIFKDSPDKLKDTSYTEIKNKISEKEYQSISRSATNGFLLQTDIQDGFVIGAGFFFDGSSTFSIGMRF